MAGSGGRRTPLTADKRYAAAAAKPAPRKPARRKTRAPARRRGPLVMIMGLFAWVFRLIFGVIWRGGVVVALIVGLAVLYVSSTLPPISQLVDGRARGSVTLTDRDGQVFAWRGDQYGGMITAETVSVHLRNAVVATEDKRFYHHIGIDFYGTAAAMVRNARENGNPLAGAGGSSIPQQTAKLLCFGEDFDPNAGQTEAEYEADCRRTTIWRKVREAVFAVAMEVKYSKDEILTVYLNRAYLGAGSRGFEAAAQRYFGKSAAEVTPAEAAMLAGLLKAPTTFAPTNNLQRSRDRAAVVINLMQEQGYLSASAAAEALANPARLSAAAEARAGGYFADWVMDSGPEFFTRNTTEDVIIHTTLDPRIQRAAEDALTWVFDNRVSEGSEAQAAIVVMSADGAVRGMVGGRDSQTSGGFNRATQASRQTGSLFKPFIYAAALDLGASPSDMIDDSPLCMDIAGSGRWCPENYDREFKGNITLAQALAESRNIPAVRLSERVGRENVRTIASLFGVKSELAAGPALALGVSESTLLEMTGAYAGILNGGSAVTPYGLVDLRLQGDAEPLMGTGGGIGERVIREDAARELTWMMSRVVAAGTGQRARIDGWELAGKSGTTQAARDAWFIGFSADYVTGVWMGYDNNTPLSGVTGGGLPAEIWKETMMRVLDGMTPVPLPMLPPQGAGNGGFIAVDAGSEGTSSEIDRALQEAFGNPQVPGSAPAPDMSPDALAEQVLQQVIQNILNGQTN